MTNQGTASAAAEGNDDGVAGDASAPSDPAVETTERATDTTTEAAGTASTDASPTPRKAAPSRGGAGSFAREIGIVVVAALVLSFLIKTFLAQPFYIPSASMEGTLVTGDKILASRLVPRVLDVHRGDIVVFKDPGGWLRNEPKTPEPTGIAAAAENVLTFIGLRPNDADEHLIKRTIGIPGDHVVCCDEAGLVTVNDVPITETYIKKFSVPSLDPFDVIVPADSLFVMGDNRSDSLDSRYNMDQPGDGFVPMDDVVGTAFVKLWPLDRLGLLRNPGSVFEDVPAP